MLLFSATWPDHVEKFAKPGTWSRQRCWLFVSSSHCMLARNSEASSQTISSLRMLVPKANTIKAQLLYVPKNPIQPYSSLRSNCSDVPDRFKKRILHCQPSPRRAKPGFSVDQFAGKKWLLPHSRGTSTSENPTKNMDNSQIFMVR